ncbi:MAG: hypothetical protein K2M93_02005 [Muribaculaceae bacterium]|nr:hypothetical protein [Muribaculaceae bacterium]
MKKVLLLASLLSVTGAYAQSLTEPKAAWANLLIGKPGQDQATDIKTDGDNQIYWMLTDGSTTDDRDVTYAGEKLYDGSVYDGTSSNKNLTILKTDGDGTKQWCVYSAWGDFAPSEGGLAVKSNGDLIFVGSVRHTDGYFDKPITIVDAKGTSTELDWTLPADGRRWDRLVVGSISSTGELQWVKTYNVDNSPVPGATGNRADFTADAINVYGAAIDNDDNIYICGNFRADMTFPKSDGSSVVLHPKNVSEWNGDPQGVAGSFYLVKLDGQGYYLNNLEEGGAEISASYIQNLEWVNGKLYAYGYMKGKDNATVTISGFDLIPSAYVSPIVGCLNSELKADWFKCFPGDAVAGKNAVQNVGMTVADGTIWLAGQYNGKISDSQDAEKFVASTQGNIREGFIIKLDQQTGAWLKSANSKTDFTQSYLTGYFKVIVPASDVNNVYVFGYAMNATVGVFLRCYDKESLVGQPDNSWNIVTKGGVPTAQNIAYTPKNGAVYVTVRGNQAFQPMGGELTENPGGYTNLLARFNLPEAFTTDVREIGEMNTSALTIELVNGGIMANNNSATSEMVTVYDLTGRKVAEKRVEAYSQEVISLASGLYIANGSKILIR